MPQTTYWIGGSSGNEGKWDLNANWSTGTFPATGDTAIVDGRGGTNAITTGLNQSAVTLAKLLVVMGSPAIGTTAAPLQISATIADINVPPTDGSSPGGASIIAIATGTNATTFTVYGSRNTGTSGIEPVVWKGTHSTNIVRILGGKVGIGTLIPGDTASAAVVQVLGKADVHIGNGVTLPTLTVAASAEDSTVLLESAVTTINQDSASSVIESRGTGAITSIYASGTVRLNSTGTITNLYVEPSGFADFTGNTAARTVTNAFMHGAGRINAALPTVGGVAHAITFTNGVDAIRGAKSGQVDFGGDITVTPSAT